MGKRGSIVVAAVMGVLTYGYCQGGSPPAKPPAKPPAAKEPAMVPLTTTLSSPTRTITYPGLTVPKGTTNLARGKPAFCSERPPRGGKREYVTDGRKAGGAGGVMTLRGGRQWMVVDLQQEADIHAIILWRGGGKGVTYRDVIVQVSSGKGGIKFKTVFNNDGDNSSGFGKGADKAYAESDRGKAIDCKGIRGRFVRLWSSGSASGAANHYVEVEVHGRPVKK